MEHRTVIVPELECNMSSQESRTGQPHKPMAPREQLERLYREIGIPAVAAAAHMASRPVVPKTTVHELPAILRDETKAA
jgi:hypothetical protein